MEELQVQSPEAEVFGIGEQSRRPVKKTRLKNRRVAEVAQQFAEKTNGAGLRLTHTGPRGLTRARISANTAPARR